MVVCTFLFYFIICKKLLHPFIKLFLILFQSFIVPEWIQLGSYDYICFQNFAITNNAPMKNLVHMCLVLLTPDPTVCVVGGEVSYTIK